MPSLFRRLRSPAEPSAPRHRYHRELRTVVVCRPAGTDPQDLPARAADALRAHGLHTDGAIPHFCTRTRRSRRLIDHWQGTAAGGPIRLLDLASMRHHAAIAAAAQWQLWHQVTAGTRPAQPFWVYAQRHHTNPHRYPLRHAQDHYLAQPRVMAMNTYNAMPHRWCELPSSSLEAFQTGLHSYRSLAWLAVVPGFGLLCTDGRWLTAASGRLADQLSYLQAANDHLAVLQPDDQLIAMAVPA